MHLTDHVTDAQLNEYLDNETTPEGRVQIESHVSACSECAARLTALKTLFDEIESLPELTPSLNLAARVKPTPGLPVPQLPRWLTLTATLQAAGALIALLIAGPFVGNLLPAVEMPSLTTIILQLQAQWTVGLDLLSTFQIPALPALPELEISSLMLTLILAGASLLWLVGNGLLLREQSK
ncbi:MAG TPA: zf-HC2 domain-containing protein [Anaerolineales bacterium]|nr:zf-HC2 domain-containing protein [Anaerolineales bacterium]